MIEFKQVTKQFQDGTIGVDNLSLKIEKGEFVSLIGPSGCGKTTTMKMINRLIEPTSGDIFIEGNSILKQSPVELRRSIGYVIQQIGLLPHMTVEENVAIVPKLLGWEKQKIKSKTEELMDLVGLDPNVYRYKYPLELSGGQQQRIGVIRALAAEPPIILMDEPFSALDPITREKLQDELKIIQKEIQKTVVFVTHDMDEALKMSDKLAILHKGQLVQLGTPEDITTNPETSFVKSFIGNRQTGKQFLKDYLSYFRNIQVDENDVMYVTEDFSIHDFLLKAYQLREPMVGIKDKNVYVETNTLVRVLLEALEERRTSVG
ncbi:ABC transporter ATP-binding protein [Mangrovibacillus cuniculi]|uniref:Quaternary amine transport ATP-binding protein n=1 Tax=Mangrovibacillus cuniculi TaxID=2593652 RepID=A0A7S8CE76_9BACI|nr:betaine/proline/choline family ABC transporter ATP-binding protein [Mangrovibacillus cuniculi]QPC48369.1 betaine/proline/choline family ABC transporter ATP-binding protein [Mangrovibacillus cuniculi]